MQHSQGIIHATLMQSCDGMWLSSNILRPSKSQSGVSLHPVVQPCWIWLQDIPHSAVMQRQDRLESRWRPLMATFGIPLDKWRRHRKQLSLTRVHAWLAALDDHIITAFEELCRTLPDAAAGTCFSGERCWLAKACLCLRLVCQAALQMDGVHFPHLHSATIPARHLSFSPTNIP